MMCVVKDNDETECECCIEGWRVDTNKNCEGEHQNNSLWCGWGERGGRGEVLKYLVGLFSRFRFEQTHQIVACVVDPEMRVQAFSILGPQNLGWGHPVPAPGFVPYIIIRFNDLFSCFFVKDPRNSEFSCSFFEFPIFQPADQTARNVMLREL